MWFEFLQFRLHTWTIPWLEIPQFRLCTRNILRLKFPLPQTEKGVAWSSEMAQFRFRTKKILWLGSYAVPLPCNKSSTTWSFTVLLPYKSFDFKSRSSASAQRILCDLKFRSLLPHKEYIMSRSSAVLLSHTEQSLTWNFAQYTMTWISAVRFRKKKRHLKLRTSASAQEHYFSWENPFSSNRPPIS